MAVALEKGQSPVYVVSGQVLSVLPGGSIIGAGGGGGATFTLNGTTASVSLVAGNNITLASNLSTISINAANNFSLNGSSSSVSISAGAGIGIGQAGSTITISASTVNTLGIAITAGNTAGATTSLTSGIVSLYGGNNITLSQSLSSITISGPNVHAATNFSLNGTSSSVSLLPGSGISLASGASSISISYSGTSNFTGISWSGNTTTAAASSKTAFTGNSIIISVGGALSMSGSTNASGGTVTLSVPAQTVQPIGTNTLSANGTSVSGTGVSLALAGAGGISAATATGAASMTVTMSYSGTSNFTGISWSGNTTTAALSSATAFSGNSLIMSVAGILSMSGTTNASGGTVTLSVPAPAAATNFSLNGTSSSVSLVAGSNIAFASGASSITISGSNQVQNFGISSSTAGGVTQGTTTVATGPILLVAGSNITLSSSAGAITIVGNSGGAGAAGTNTISASGTSIVGTALSLALFGGNNIKLATATGASSMSITISESLASKISYTQPMGLNEIGVLTSTSGTVTGTAAFGSSLFLQRIFLPAAMTLTEADVALALSFAATSNGAGTMTRMFALYSFGNSTSLASVMSISGSSTWTTGTVTAGASTSLSQFQGGWSGSNIVPMTFAGTSVSAGEYVVANLINFAQLSSTWSLSLMGPNVGVASAATIGSALGSTTGAGISNAGTAAGAYISNAGTAAINNVELSSNTFAGSAVSGFSSATSISTKTEWVSARTIFTVAPTAANRTDFTVAPTAINAVTSVSLSTLGITYVAGTTLPNFGYVGTGSTTSNFPTWFSAGVMSTGSIPTAITLTSAAVTISGSVAQIQPWYALVGS